MKQYKKYNFFAKKNSVFKNKKVLETSQIQ